MSFVILKLHLRNEHSTGRISIVRLRNLIIAACLAAGLPGCDATTQSIEGPHIVPGTRPVYPPEAVKDGRTGTVTVDCAITEGGRARNCVVTAASDPIFVPSALAFVGHATYHPARRAGVPVAVAHHTFAVNYTHNLRHVVLSGHCDVQPSGVVRNCRPDQVAAQGTWPLARLALEKLIAVPTMADGHPVDDPDRAVVAAIAMSPLPLAGPLPPMAGDVVVSMPISCVHRTTSAPTPPMQCGPSNDAGAGSNPAGILHYQADIGITGIVPQPTGDFTQ